MKSKIVKLLFTSITFVILTACNIIEPRLYNKSPEIIPVINEKEINDANYMARYLLDFKDRTKIENKARNEEIKRNENYDSITAGIAGTMLLGNNPTSSQGVGTATDIIVGIEAAGLVLSMLGSDGSIDRVSKIYIPNKVNNQTINTIEEATHFAKKYTKEGIQFFSIQENRSFECVYGCVNSNLTIYKLIKNGFTGEEPYDASIRGGELYDGNYFDPPKLFVITFGSDIVKSKPDPIRDRIMGYTPLWESKYENGWRMFIAAELLRDADGNIKFKNDKFLGEVPVGWYAALGSPLSRRFFRVLTGGENLIYRGRDHVFDDTFSIKGKIFEFGYRSAYQFMQHEISSETDVATTGKNNVD